MQLDRFRTRSLQDERILRILAAALDAVEPGLLVQHAVHSIPSTHGDVYALALGKAAQPMLESLVRSLPVETNLAITKHAARGSSPDLQIIEGGHPIPDQRSLDAGQAALDFVSDLQAGDLLICLISGGGSALACAPVDDVSLGELQSMTSSLLASGASVAEINIIRRSLDRIKGGGLAQATRAKVVSLILSDVLGNPLEAIASGPTFPNPTTHRDALEVLRKYALQPASSIIRYLESDLTVRMTQDAPRLENYIIGDIQTAAQAAASQARTEGFETTVLGLDLTGEASQIGRQLAMQLKANVVGLNRSFCLLAGGETTVTLHGHGKGGRNQELSLAAVDVLDGMSAVLLVSLATDGEDGPTDAAGAVVTGSTADHARGLGLSSSDSLSRNNAYAYFDRLGDLIKTGPTGTNVNDLVLMFGL